jgi:hypothetical protein
MNGMALKITGNLTAHLLHALPDLLGGQQDPWVLGLNVHCRASGVIVYLLNQDSLSIMDSKRLRDREASHPYDLTGAFGHRPEFSLGD